ncbi:nicotinate N-methyltransferase 1-like isoform X2 [Nymphaea colorata]|nr:nicotinate N-methyltransferase 1-like isoform X2 [Nymphaea colorata]
MENKEARLRMMYLANLISVPMALHAAVKLSIPDLVWQGGANLPISPKQLAALIQSKLGLATEPDTANLQRILQVLASHGVFEEVLESGSQAAKAFRLTHIGQTLVPDEQGLSLGAYILRNYQDAFVQAWPHLHESVLDPRQEPFKRAHGVPVYDYYARDSTCNLLMQKAMSSISLPFLRAVLDSYDGFGSEGLKRIIVDVGGSSGSCVAMIVDRYPGLQGINFDLPQVVADAPQHKGVTHIGGNMFDYVPEGDIIFMKSVLNSYSDEECKKVLENCHKALPENGKFILCDMAMPRVSDDSERTRMLLVFDIFLMTFHAANCRNRTESENRKLCEAVGFTGFKAFYNFDHFTTLMEFQK